MIPAVANGFSFQTAILRDTDSQAAEPGSRSLTVTVCYAHFLVFPYLTVIYAKRAAYRLKAVDACLLSLPFAYLAVEQRYTQILRLQTQYYFRPTGCCNPAQSIL